MSAPARLMEPLAPRPVSLLRVLRRVGLVLLNVAILVALLVAFLSARRPPVYEAVGEVRLSTASTALDGAPLAARDMERRVLDEVDRFRSPAVLQGAADRMEGFGTAADVRRALVVRGDASSSYLTLTARASTRGVAGLLVTRVVEAYEEVVRLHREGEADRMIASLDAYAEQLDTRTADLRASLDARRAEVEAALPDLETAERTQELDRRLALDPTHADLDRRLAAVSTQLESVRSQMAAAQVGAALAGSGVEAFEITRASTTPVSPAPTRDAAVVAVLVLALGISVAWARAGRDPSRTSAEDVAGHLSVPVLGRLPRGGFGRVLRSRGAGAEVHTRTREVVEHALGVRPATTVLVSSADQGCPTTTTVIEVATLAARGGRDVLVVDADLRERALTRALGLLGRPGWSDLGPTVDPSSCVHTVTDGDVRLRVVPAGTRTGPTHPLGGDLGDLVELLPDCQVLLVGSPPLPSSAETALLAPVVDGLVLLVPPELDLEVARRTVAEARRVDDRLLGVIVAAPPSRLGWRPGMRLHPESPSPEPARSSARLVASSGRRR